MVSEAKKRANAKSDAKNTVMIPPLKLSKNTDKDIIEWLATKPNRQGYIKQLIRNDMENDK